jgi:putative ferrous iron transport protein C
VNLIAVKNYMVQVKITSLANLCLMFKRDPETLRQMLKHWMRKGKIKQCTKKAACGSQCFKCPVPSIEIYEWIDD